MRRDSGFSMVELMIAMTCTLIISGAIYGLLTAGETAFRREPEMADRQQNIRMAMDLIARDVFGAGSALPTFTQVFSRVDPAGLGSCVGGQGLNGCGPEGSLGPTIAAARAPGDGGDPLTATDAIEIISTDETCPEQTVCSPTQAGFTGSPVDFVIRQRLPTCAAGPGVVMMTDGTDFALHMSQSGATPSSCLTGGDPAQNGTIKLGSALPLFTPGPLLPSPEPVSPPPVTPVIFFRAGNLVRYEIAPSNDPLDPGPALWRSRSGRFSTADGLPRIAPDGNPLPGGSPWQLVARGIEDLQIEYMGGDLLWRNNPPVSVVNDWTTLVRRVRITLSARASGVLLQGATTAGGAAPDAIRGQLVTVVAPRAALNELKMGFQIQ